MVLFLWIKKMLLTTSALLNMASAKLFKQGKYFTGCFPCFLSSIPHISTSYYYSVEAWDPPGRSTLPLTDFLLWKNTIFSLSLRRNTGIRTELRSLLTPSFPRKWLCFLNFSCSLSVPSFLLPFFQLCLSPLPPPSFHFLPDILPSFLPVWELFYVNHLTFPSFVFLRWKYHVWGFRVPKILFSSIKYIPMPISDYRVCNGSQHHSNSECGCFPCYLVSLLPISFSFHQCHCGLVESVLLEIIFTHVMLTKLETSFHILILPWFISPSL